MNIKPPSYASPDKLKAKAMNIKPTSHASPDKPKAEAMNVKPPSYVSPVKSKTMNFIIKPFNHTTELTFRKCTRKRKLIATQTINDLRKKYQELYSTIIDGERLTDRHIDAANQLLSDKLPDIQGLSTPLLGQKLQYPV